MLVHLQLFELYNTVTKLIYHVNVILLKILIS